MTVGNDDDLFSPSLQGAKRHRGKEPWAPNMHLWVAFFGGVLAVTALSYLNSGRLAMERRQRLWIVAVGAAAVALATGIAIWLGTMVGPETSISSQRSFARLATRAVALAAYTIMRRLQRTASRVYGLRHDAKYASGWGDALAFILGFGLLQSLLTSWFVSIGAGL